MSGLNHYRRSSCYLETTLTRAVTPRESIRYWFCFDSRLASWIICVARENGGNSLLKRSRVSLCVDFVARLPPLVLQISLFISLDSFFFHFMQTLDLQKSYDLSFSLLLKDHTTFFFIFINTFKQEVSSLIQLECELLADNTNLVCDN